jgi:hypothetical protein
MRPTILILYMLVSACACGQARASDRPERVSAFTHELQRLAAPLPPDSTTAHRSKDRRQTLRSQDRMAKDGYQGAERWCETPLAVYCKSDLDCKNTSMPGSKPHRCVRPWWASAAGKRKAKTLGDIKVCGAPWPTKRERDWRKARLGEIVAAICSGPGCDPRDLSAFLGHVAARESSWRPWKAHRLGGDVRANESAWTLRAKRYGHAHLVVRHRKSDEVVGVKLTETGNPYYGQQDRWQGWGYYGQNAALFTAVEDPMAPPEILCREIESTDAYLARARSIVRKQIDLGITPTWATVHYALGTGDLKPKSTSVAKFSKKAKRFGIDGSARVTTRSFGRPLGPDVPSRRLAAEILRGKVETKFPTPLVLAGS